MPRPPKRVYHEVLEEHRDRLTRLTERRGVKRLKKLYDEAQGSLIKKIAAATGPGRSDFTAHQHRVAMAQVKQGQMMIANKMRGELTDLTHEAQVESLRGLSSSIATLEAATGSPGIVLPIDEAARFAGVIDARATSLLRVHQTSMTRYGKRMVGAMEGQLAQSLITQETNDQAIARLEETADLEWYQAERIVRTETAWAANATHADGIREAAKVLTDLWMRWSEHCSDDAVPMPFDDRVGIDSLAMHGQVAPPGGQFVMPPTAPDGSPVSRSLVGHGWTHPPNRPNDRAALAPWRPHWGVPGWQWRGGLRVPVTDNESLPSLDDVDG